MREDSQSDVAQRETGEMTLLCFHIRDDEGRSKFFSVNVLRTQEICMFTEEIRNSMVSVGKGSVNDSIRGAFSHRGEIVSAVDLRAWAYGKRGEDYNLYVVIRAGNCTFAVLANSNPDPFTLSSGSWISHDLRSSPFYAGGKSERAAEISDGPYAGSLVDIIDIDQLVHDLNPDFLETQLAQVEQACDKPLKKILLVDDSGTARKQAMRIFQHAGFKYAQTFETPEELLSHVRAIGHEEVGLVIADLEMARGMGGEGLIRTIRANESMASLPILVYSGMLDDNRRRIVAELGATDFAEKGKPQELVEKINLHALTR